MHIFTVNTYQAAFICDILLYNYRNWKCDVTGKMKGQKEVKVEIVM